nr:hypothetical protein CBC38_05775 [uncultured bacterium]
MKATSRLAASIRTAAGLVAAATLTVSTATFAQPPGPAGEQFKVVTVAEGLRNPWSMAWLPNGDMLVTERGAGDYPGSLRIIRGGKLLPTPVAGVPAVRAQGQGGMQEVAVHPNYAQNGYIYLSYAKPRADGMEGTTALTRAKLQGDRLVDAKEIFEAKAWNNAPGHFGARIAFDGQGHLFMSVGDRMAGLFPRTADGGMDPNLEGHPAQRLDNHQGKILRLNDDGTVPNDNPFVGRAARCRKSGATATGTRRASLTTQRPAGFGRRSTARRVATSSTSSRRARTTAGPSSATARTTRSAPRSMRAATRKAWSSRRRSSSRRSVSPVSCCTRVTGSRTGRATRSSAAWPGIIGSSSGSR